MRFSERGSPNSPAVASAWLWTTAGMNGAAVMAVEFLGARKLSTGYGGSVVVWAAMISVTLLSLAVGYFVGGALADRSPRPALLYTVLLVAGALLALCPHTGFILRACYDALGTEAGALASSFVIFFLPLCLLGMTSPFVIKVLTERGRPVGKTAGGVYGLSTVGSVAGSLVTAFVLIPSLGPAAGFRATAVVVTGVAAVGLVITARWSGAAALAVPIALWFVPVPGTRPGDSYALEDGSRITVRDVRHSVYGHITVLERGEYRLLVVDGIVQTGILTQLHRVGKAQHLRDHYFQELLPYMVNDPRAARALIIGVAGGLTATLLQKHGVVVDCVDLDPEMFAVARKWFSFTGNEVVADGRRFLERCETRYDFCVIDTYSGDSFPFWMATVECLRAAKAVLKPGGVLAVNFIGSPAGRPFACIYRTLGEVFPDLLALRAEESDDVQTLTLFASDRSIAFNKGWLDDLGDAGGPDAVSLAIRRLAVVPSRTDGLVLNDERNPIDFLRSGEAVRWRSRTAERIGSEGLFQ